MRISAARQRKRKPRPRRYSIILHGRQIGFALWNGQRAQAVMLSGEDLPSTFPTITAAADALEREWRARARGAGVMPSHKDTG
jgi:hypothetical protein